MNSKYGARKGLFSVALEEHTPTEETPIEQTGEATSSGKHDTESLGEGWKDVVFSLVENGPMAPGDISEGGISSLAEQGFVTKVVTSGEEFKFAATEKGVELYNQVVGGSTLEESIAKRKEWMKRDPDQAEEAAEQAADKAKEEAQDAQETRQEAAEIGRISEQAAATEDYAKSSSDAPLESSAGDPDGGAGESGYEMQNAGGSSEIAQEAFNWFRRELKAEDISGMSNNLGQAEKNVSKITDTGDVNLFHVDSRVARYPFHGETAVPNLVKAMGEEANSIKALTGILKHLTAASSSANAIDRYDPSGDSQRLASLKFLGGIDIDVDKDPKASASGKSVRDNHESTFPNIAISVIGFLIFAPMISLPITAVNSYLVGEKKKRNAKLDREAAREYFTVNGSNYKSNAKSVINASRECIAVLQQFQRNIEKLEDSGDKSLKDFINYAKGVAFAALDVLEANLLFMIRSGTKKAS